MLRADRRPTVLVVTLDESLRTALQRFLSRAGYDAVAAREAGRAADILAAGGVDLVLCSAEVAGQTPSVLITDLLGVAPDLPLIVLCAIEETQTAVECLKAGAWGYLLAPVHFEELELVLNDALEWRRQVAEREASSIELARRARRIHELEGAAARLFQAFLRLGDTECRRRREQVVTLVTQLARSAGLDREAIETLVLAAAIDSCKDRAETRDLVTPETTAALVGGCAALELLERAADDFGDQGTQIPVPARIYRAAQVMLDGGPSAPDLAAAQRQAGMALDPDIVALAASLIS